MNLLVRTGTSAVLIGLCAAAILMPSPALFGACVFAFTGVGLYEFFTLMKAAKFPVYRMFGVSMGLIVTVAVFLGEGITRSGEVLFLVLGCLFLFVIQFSRKNNVDALIGIALTLFGILYVSWFLSFILKIRFLEDGQRWVAYLICVTKSTDIGAYLVGSAIGRHPLIPHVSPKKSVEGLIGGLALAAVVSVVWGNFLPHTFSLPHLIVLGILLGIIGQIGDLSESLMKRFCGAKDSGKLLPGMGGALDLIDSVLFTAPIFYFHLKIFV